MELCLGFGQVVLEAASVKCSPDKVNFDPCCILDTRTSTNARVYNHNAVWKEVMLRFFH